LAGEIYPKHFPTWVMLGIFGTTYMDGIYAVPTIV
jgi:hypothetical protein